MSFSETKIVKLVIAREVEIECPHCGMPQKDFRCDPLGHTFDCDDCHKHYEVSVDSVIETR